MTESVVAAVLAATTVALAACGTEQRPKPPVGEITRVRADMDGVTRIETSKAMSCDEAHEIAKQWVRACGDGLNGCAHRGARLSCWSAAIGETPNVRCTDGEDRWTRFVVHADS